MSISEGKINTEITDGTAELAASEVATRRTPMFSSRIRVLLSQVAVLAAVLVIWELVVAVGVTTEFWVSRPSLVAEELVDLFSTSAIWEDIWVTLQATLLGFGIGCVAGIVFGLVLGVWRWLSDAVDPIIVALNSMPRVALAPLFVLYFGIGIWSKVALAVSLVLFIMMLNARAGVRSADPDLVNAVRTMGGGKLFVVRKVLIPGTIPWLLSGARLSIGFSLIGIVVGEMLVSQRGLGHIIQQDSSVFDTTGVFAVIIILSVGAVILDQALLAIEKIWNRRFGIS